MKVLTYGLLSFHIWGFVRLVNSQIQAPAIGSVGAPTSDADRIYTGDQSSNTVTVISPSTAEVLGTIALGDTRVNDVLGPQYIKNVNVHGLGFSRDGKYVVSLSVTSNTVSVIRCENNTVVSQTYVDRQSHEAFFSADNRTIWVGTRGVDRINIVDGVKGGVIGYVNSYGGPSKVLFSPDGKTAYANHIRSSSVSVIDVQSRTVKHNITGLAGTFSSDMMLSGDGERLWVAHKMIGKVSVISTRLRKVVHVLETGPETNHPNFAVLNGTTYGFVTVAALNETKMYRQRDATKAPKYVASIKSSGVEPHGLWPSPDNKHLYVVNEHSDTVDFINLESFPPRVIKTLRVGQEGQALVYVAQAVTRGDGRQNLGEQGLSSQPVFNRIIHETHRGRPVGNASALITIRPQTGLDMFQVIGRNLAEGKNYTVSAACKNCHGAVVPLVEFSATTMTDEGCTAPQVLSFFNWNGAYEPGTLQLVSEEMPR